MKVNLTYYLAKGFSLALLGLFYCLNLYSQPSIEWEKCFGGSLYDNADCIIQTTDGGYAFAGLTKSKDGDVFGKKGSDIYSDIWIVKLDSKGKLEWQKCLGGTLDEEAKSIYQTNDGGYIVAGLTVSNDGDVFGLLGQVDYWVLKLDFFGNIEWQKCLGGKLDDIAFSVLQTSDNGFVIAGGSKSNGIDKYALNDGLIIKLDSLGNILWQKYLKGNGEDVVYDIQPTNDNSFILAGSSFASGGDNHFWVVKIDSSGSQLWEKRFGGSDPDFALSVKQTIDNGYIVTGGSWSRNGDLTENHGNKDYWVIKLDGQGNIQWQKSFGGSEEDVGYSIIQTFDRGYIIAGYTLSNDGNITEHHGPATFSDIWLVKLDENGTLDWQKSYGGLYYDQATSIQQTLDSGFIVCGSTSSNDGDVSSNHGGGDAWILKLSSFNDTPFIINDTNNISIYPNPTKGLINIYINLAQAEKVIITCYNMLGQNLLYENHSTLSGEQKIKLDLSFLSKGVYILQTIIGDKIINHKIIIN